MMLVDGESILSVTDINTTLQFPSSAYTVLQTFHTTMLVFAILGNCIVLYGILCFNAINMDRISLLFILNLTVIDIIISLINGTTVCSTLFARRWVAGEAMCFIQGMVCYVFIFAELHTLVAISLHRLWTLLNPLHARNFNETRARLVVLGVWGLALGAVVMAVFVQKQYTYFEPALLSCNTSGLLNPGGNHTFFTIVVIVVFGCIPLLFMVLFNILILCIASRFVKRQDERIAASSPNVSACRARKISINAAITVSLISWVFLFSVGPLVIRAMLQTLHVELPNWFCVLQTEAYFLNVALNPLVYTFTVVSFRRFLKRDLVLSFMNKVIWCRTWGGADYAFLKLQRISTQDRITQRMVNTARRLKMGLAPGSPSVTGKMGLAPGSPASVTGSPGCRSKQVRFTRKGEGRPGDTVCVDIA